MWWIPLAAQAVKSYTHQSNQRRQQTRQRVLAELQEEYAADKTKLLNEDIDFANFQEDRLDDYFAPFMGESIAMMTAIPDPMPNILDMQSVVNANIDTNPTSVAPSPEYMDALASMGSEITADVGGGYVPMLAGSSLPSIADAKQTMAAQMIAAADQVRMGADQVGELVQRNRPVSQTPHELAALYKDKIEGLGPIKNNPLTGLGEIIGAAGSAYNTKQLSDLLTG